MKVRDIPYEEYKRIAVEERFRFSYLFLANYELDEELLHEIHFNATHSMSTAVLADKHDMETFIAGTLVGCRGSSKEELARANEEMRRLGWE